MVSSKQSRPTSDLWADANRSFYDSMVWKSVRTAKGPRVHKFPTDLYVYEEIIRRTKPDIIVETGSWEGGSAAWFSQWAGVISVDLKIPDVSIPGTLFIEGDSVQMAGEIAKLVEGQGVLVSLDSDHNAAHVLRELDAYAPIATDYLVVEDTAVDVYGIELDRYADGGPGRAVDWWLLQHPEWKADLECDRFMLGMNPGGWLRRAA